MLYFGILLITLVMVGARAVLGRRVADLLPPTLVPVGRSYFAPVFGIAAVMLFATLHGWFRPFSLTTTAIPMVIALALSVWFERDRQALLRDMLPLIVLTVVRHRQFYFRCFATTHTIRSTTLSLTSFTASGCRNIRS